MTKKTLKALHQSIAHWERLKSGTQTVGESIYANDCHLCQQFRKAAGRMVRFLKSLVPKEAAKCKS